MAGTIVHKAMAATPTLRVTIVNGGKSFTAIPTKKNEPPHNTDKVASITHSRSPIEVLIGDAIVNSSLVFLRKTA
jgi:hypothetical protein